MNDYYTKQIITYIGNKRKILPYIETIINYIKKDLKKEKLNIGEGFSGSGIISRLFKNHALMLYANDLAGYSKTLNECYLASPNKNLIKEICKYIIMANKFVDKRDNKEDKFIQKYWSPKSKIIKKQDRVYYTYENGIRIDRYRYFINKIPNKYKPFLLAPLLVEASIHNNCSGNFSAYYKKDNIGHLGGKNEIDINRITKNIEIPFPIFSINNCKIKITQEDANKWITNVPELDLVYYDPPYNKHPYHIYYFLLDIINNWDTTIQIPNTFRGQPKNWLSSDYNSSIKAKQSFEELIKNTKAKYILVSYNNKGIISEKDMRNILKKYGILQEIFIEHATYNRMKGIAEYKKTNKEISKIKECLYLLKVF